MKIHIKGQIRGGKNHMQVSRLGHHYPNKEFVKWRTDAITQVNLQSEKLKIKDHTLLWYFDYTPSDNRRRDITAVLDAVFHVLEKCEIVTDDSKIKNINFKTYPADKERAGIWITAVKPDRNER